METGRTSSAKYETDPAQGRAPIRLRREGRVPGVLYGPKTTPIAIAVSGARAASNRVAHARQPAHHAAQVVGSSELNGKHVHREGHPARAGLAARSFMPIFTKSI